jgi:hypothetical protein
MVALPTHTAIVIKVKSEPTPEPTSKVKIVATQFLTEEPAETEEPPVEVAGASPAEPLLNGNTQHLEEGEEILDQISSGENLLGDGWLKEGGKIDVEVLEDSVLYIHSDPGLFTMKDDDGNVIFSEIYDQQFLLIAEMKEGYSFSTGTIWCEIQEHQCSWSELFKSVTPLLVMQKYGGTTISEGENDAPVKVIVDSSGKAENYTPSEPAGKLVMPIDESPEGEDSGLVAIASASDGIFGVAWETAGAEMVYTAESDLVVYYHSDPGTMTVLDAEGNELVSESFDKAFLAAVEMKKGYTFKSSTPHWCENQLHQCSWSVVYEPTELVVLMELFQGTADLEGEDPAPYAVMIDAEGNVEFYAQP